MQRLPAIAGRVSTLRERFRLGIAARQVAAFICVGLLVLAANFIVEQGVLVERTTEIVRQAPPSTPVVTKPVQAAPPVIAAPPPVPVVQRRVLSSEGLTSALDHYKRAALERAIANNPETDAEYQRSASELATATHDFVAQAGSLTGKSFSELTSRVTNYRARGDELLMLADQRREMLADYSTLFETIYGRANASMEGAWKVFGRVIARQSLVQLRADLDALRRSSALVATASSVDTPTIKPLLDAESAVSNDLHLNERGLTRSEGVPWFTSMQADMTVLMTLRASILQANSQLQQRVPELAGDATRLVKLIPARVEGPVVIAAPVRAERAAPRSAERAPSPAPTLTAPALSTGDAIAPDVTSRTTWSTTTNATQEHRRKRWIAVVSIAVLLALSLIAWRTVLSVIGPVRRLRDATARLAAGETAVRVERGGVRELDTLAVAFNSMAEELAAARALASEYQQALEAKVVERTHQLQELAVRDPLTGLPNRREFFALLNAAIERATGANSRVGVYFLDIDNFKYLNDSMGHAFGDRVLVSLARRLQTASSGFGFAARLGGDEFTAVLENAESPEDIELIGSRLVKAFQRPLSVDGRDLVVSVSVGASVFPDHEKDAEALLTAADIALFRAKALGRSQLSMFSAELFDAAASRFKTEQGLRHALEHDGFELVFQPEVSAEDLETVLVEALIRWRMPDGSLTSADKFLHVAEESGLILELGDWVLRTAIEAASQWHHGHWLAARVAINVSPRQLLDSGFVARVCELLEQHDLPAHCIEIELTESVLQTGAATIAALKSLRERGVAIALDDFGTGYSSFSSLEALPLTRVKLDRSLIAGIDTNPRSAAIAQAIIAMCHGLGLQITAEGIERPEQFSTLVRQPGMYLQGYLLGYPTARDELLSEMVHVARRAQELVLTAGTVEPIRQTSAAMPSISRSA